MNRYAKLATQALAIAFLLQGAQARQPKTGSVVQSIPSIPFTAIVGKEMGTFSFPYPSEKRFEWCPGGKQYGFEVNTRGKTGEYEFGYALFTATGGGTCERGNLPTLLEAGQTGAFLVEGETGSLIPKSDHDILIRADAPRKLIVVQVTGKKMVQSLFGSRPGYVEFLITKPNGVEKRRVKVQYVS